MNFIKRSFLSLQSRKGKSLILLAIFLVVINLVFAGFTIQSASSKATDLARQQLGADINLRIDINKYLEEQNNNQNANEARKVPSIEKKEADKLKNSKYLDHYNYLKSAIAELKELHNVEPSGGAQSFGPNNNLNFTLQGVRDFFSLEAAQDKKLKLIEGEGITSKTIGKNVAMIEKKLAEKNNLKVGDKLQIGEVMDEELTTKELEIIGIYESKEEAPSFGGQSFALLEPANQIYLPYSVMTSLENAIYSLKDPKDIDAFKEEAKKLGLPAYYELDAQDNVYKQMIGPIENIASFSKTIVIMVSIAAATILGLIIMLSIKERRKEIGILLSIGEKKWKLMGQLLVEVLCIAVLAFGLSLATGEKVSQKVGDNLLSSEIAKNEDKPEDPIAKLSGNPAADVDPVDNIDVSISTEDLGKVGGIGLGIAMLGTILPALSILRLNPKQILLKDE
ncbi:ABC transporter permease [Bacillus cereus]|uniref:ABC transporter permease n=1 Tax=Bacillus thuringiensis TaxID=1428 RepID=UPI000BF5C3EA|nr:ABC transporter permease [Bacillus thuringiensis]HDR3884475.1 ABC transporter permease [Bacillus cereus]MED3620180.1 ABC transporter permease [Bacillus thuringiensis]PEW83233.1 permease [Bacillus thuringiensis]PFA80803.1 permease [Bacillus thuringiensis]PFB51149.1 permease [Bacillus thuringiensis]